MTYAAVADIINYTNNVIEEFLQEKAYYLGTSIKELTRQGRLVTYHYPSLGYDDYILDDELILRWFFTPEIEVEEDVFT